MLMPSLLEPVGVGIGLHTVEEHLALGNGALGVVAADVPLVVAEGLGDVDAIGWSRKFPDIRVIHDALPVVGVIFLAGKSKAQLPSDLFQIETRIALDNDATVVGGNCCRERIP